jgi:hypothetical protein
MKEAEEKQGIETTRKYLALVSMIEGIQNRLKYSEPVYILLNLIVFFGLINFFGHTVGRVGRPEAHIHILFIFFCHVIGLFMNTHWAAASARLHLKLKLRYFQARFLERRLNRSGEFILSDEELFFDPETGRLESPDGKETLFYPKKGFLRMDGFVGSARPRVLSLVLPLLFFILYLVSLIVFVIFLFR